MFSEVFSLRGDLIARAGRFLLFAAALAMLSPGVSWAGVAGTKHNFGSLSAATVKTTESTEICVFCHTPHNSSPSGPLWNRQDSGATYDVYASSTLATTLSPNSPQLGQPTGSSKLCLSCHDGTIAIGSLLNLPGKGFGTADLSVTGAGVDPSGRLTSASTSYIGTDLRDDHPISFDYGLSFPSNPEINDPASFPPEVKLDSTNMVQCVSCHDPHGTVNPKFLVASLEGGALCNTCHTKRYWATMPAVHGTATATWTGTGENPWREDMGAPGYTDDTPQMQSCLACHSSHGGASGKSLLTGVNPLTLTVDDEEWTCLNCHNGNVATKDMNTALNHMYSHDVKATFGAHDPARGLAGEPARETALNLGTNRHVECADCHNGHGAKAGNHTIGGVNGNIIAPNILGSWGVKPSPWPVAGTEATSFVEVDFTTTLPGADNLEGQLCLKCHSFYAYGFNPPNVPSGNADGSLVRQSDITTDMNPSNMSIHPVFGQGKNTPPVAANINWPANTLGLSNTFRYLDFPGVGPRDGFYNMTHDSKTTCSDCHSSSDVVDPLGPHGSTDKWILRRNETGAGTLKNFCYNCHRRDVYGDVGYLGPNANYSRVTHPVDGLGLASPFYSSGPTIGNNANHFGNLCMSCHGGGYDALSDSMKATHGSNAAAGASGDPLGYRMMNGACVETHTAATPTTGVGMTFRNVVPGQDPVCRKSLTDIITTSGNLANYSCLNKADCAF
jgi:predicted CXXCH cytochrome family protein